MKFCVRAVLVNTNKNEILSIEYSKKLSEYISINSESIHAEQYCFIKVTEKHNLSEERINDVLSKNIVLYTTIKSCNKRLSGNRTCVERILRLNDVIKVIYIRIKESRIFIKKNIKRKRLENADIVIVFIKKLQDRILKIFLIKHKKQNN